VLVRVFLSAAGWVDHPPPNSPEVNEAWLAVYNKKKARAAAKAAGEPVSPGESDEDSPEDPIESASKKQKSGTSSSAATAGESTSTHTRKRSKSDTAVSGIVGDTVVGGSGGASSAASAKRVRSPAKSPGKSMQAGAAAESAAVSAVHAGKQEKYVTITKVEQQHPFYFNAFNASIPMPFAIWGMQAIT
jgi:hypothetical protein